MSTGSQQPSASPRTRLRARQVPSVKRQPYDTDALTRDAAARAELVGRTLDKHPSIVTHVTAPHFYLTNERTARLNIDLAERTRLAVG